MNREAMKSESVESHPVPTDGASADSLLARTMAQVGDTPFARLSFEDLTGVTRDNPVLHLPYESRIHRCEFCLFAKSRPESHLHCVRNKMAANRVGIRRRQAFAGQCHLGMTDLVHPLEFRGTVLGIFYYGSFVLTGTEEMGRQRIRRFCARHGFDAEESLAQFERAPRVEAAALADLQRRLGLVVDLVRCMVESIGIPVDRYRTRSGAQFSAWHGAMPSLVRSVITYLNQHYADSIRVGDVAHLHKCHPDHLSRSFKRTVGLGLIEYLHRVRIDHARRLLMTERFTVGEVGHLVGFPDQSHFGRVFRQWEGVSPQAFRAAQQTRTDVHPTFSTFEYSNIRPFNPKFSQGLVNPDRYVM